MMHVYPAPACFTSRKQVLAIDLQAMAKVPAGKMPEEHLFDAIPES